MPFTLCHPAAVLPLFRRPFVPAALVAGAMAPDVPYFLDVPVSAQSWYRDFVNATETHSLLGILRLDLLLALALLALYWTVRRPVAALLPLRPSRVATGRTAAERARLLPWVLVSAALGALTHVLWDSFTHWDGYVVRHYAFMRADVVAGLDVARLLQHLSTLAGGAVLLWWVARAWRRNRLGPAERATRPSRANGLVLSGLAAAALFGGVLEVVRRPGQGTPGERLEYLLSGLAKGGGAALAVALLAYALLWHASELLGRRATPAAAPTDSASGAGRTGPGMSDGFVGTRTGVPEDHQPLSDGERHELRES
ncbi:DUF4184 family protein [Streptomyces durbertensis]|uniref:DUF4184 family protein n=1 Tax=Streptomyces durbertensis TaxID=2448886 RepID=A0ABR6EAH6_9ACTN|nr:DUF4184 family protein [Streptomyces durbertensis]MBB1242344.1 DUF4184 family protein [Streptomyces durbertensis]